MILRAIGAWAALLLVLVLVTATLSRDRHCGAILSVSVVMALPAALLTFDGD